MVARKADSDRLYYSELCQSGSLNRKAVFDPLRVYHIEATKYTLLNHDEEICLGKELEMACRGIFDVLMAYNGRDSSGNKKAGFGFLHPQIERYHYRKGKKGKDVSISAYQQFSQLEEKLKGDQSQHGKIRLAEKKQLYQQLFELLCYTVPRKMLKESGNSLLHELRQEHAEPLPPAREDYVLSSMQQLREQLQREKKITDTFVNSNLRLALGYAVRSYHQFKHAITAMDVQDFIQAANMGLMKAADKYDYRRDTRFCTYAMPWIQQSVTKMLSDCSRTVRFTSNAVEMNNRLQRMRSVLRRELSREPSEQEVAERAEVGVEVVQHYATLPHRQINLQDSWGAENTDTVEDHLADARITPQDDAAEAKVWKERLQQGMAKILTPREEKILRMRFGMGEEQQHTLEEVGTYFELTRERIRQIEAKALRKLREKMVSREDEVA